MKGSQKKQRAFWEVESDMILNYPHNFLQKESKLAKSKTHEQHQ